MEDEWEQSKFRAIFSLVLGWALIPVIWFFGISRIAIIDKSLVLFGTITFWSIIGIMTVATILVTLKIRKENKGEEYGKD